MTSTCCCSGVGGRNRHRVRKMRWRAPTSSGWLLFVGSFLISPAFMHPPVGEGGDIQMHTFSHPVFPVAYAAVTQEEEEEEEVGTESAENNTGNSSKNRQLKGTKELVEEKQQLRGAESIQVRYENDPQQHLSLNQLLAKAGKRGLGGGIPGFIAGIFQVLSLMWLRTIINYQCRYGASFREAFVTLRNEGGLARFYRGWGFALVQAPVSRFVSTASNDGVEALMAAIPFTSEWGPARTTVVASLVVGAMRIVLMPIDTCKTVLQIDSTEGFRNLMRRVKAGQVGVLYQGSIAMAVSAIMAHYPWFYTYNILSQSVFLNTIISSSLLRNAGIGVAASFVSDTIVNSIRVIKTTKQAMGSKHTVSYLETVNLILAADGWRGLLGRGLRSRIYANALQSLVFTVIWRGLADVWKKKSAERDLSEASSEHVLKKQ